MPRRRADKIDTNQPEIVEGLEKMGYSVVIGMDDIVVGHAGKTYWYEIKRPESRSKKTGEILDSYKKDCQIELEKTFKGHYRLITSIEDILEDLKPSIY